MDDSKLLTLTFTVRKKAGMSFEDFVAHLNGVHGVLSSDLLAKYGIIEFTQVSEGQFRLGSQRTDVSPDLQQC